MKGQKLKEMFCNMLV